MVVLLDVSLDINVLNLLIVVGFNFEVGLFKNNIGVLCNNVRVMVVFWCIFFE